MDTLHPAWGKHQGGPIPRSIRSLTTDLIGIPTILAWHYSRQREKVYPGAAAAAGATRNAAGLPRGVRQM